MWSEKKEFSFCSLILSLNLIPSIALISQVAKKKKKLQGTGGRRFLFYLFMHQTNLICQKL